MRTGRAKGVEGAQCVDPKVSLHDTGLTADDRQLLGDAGIGDDDVQSAELGDELLDGPVDGIGVGHIALAPRRVVAGGDLGEELGLQAREGHAGPVGGEEVGDPGAEAAGRARDEDATAAEGRGVLRTGERLITRR